DRIVHYVEEHLLQSVAVASYQSGAVRFILELQLNMLLLRFGPDVEHRLLKQLFEVHLSDYELHLVGLQLREIKDLLHEANQTIGLFRDNPHPDLRLLWIEAAGG